MQNDAIYESWFKDTLNEHTNFRLLGSKELKGYKSYFLHFRLHTSVPHSIPMDATDVYLDGNNLANFTSQETQTNHLFDIF